MRLALRLLRPSFTREVLYMRRWLFMLAALALSAVSGPASAQARLDCATAPASVCADGEVMALEAERLALTAQLAAADPQHAALAGEQLWIDGLAACGEDLACYRTAYLNHNQTLRQAVDALPAAQAAPPPEAPPDAAAVEEAPAASERRAARADARDRDGPTYAPAGLPGWGFFTAIGVTLLIFYALLRRLGRHRRELRAQETRLRDW